MKSVLNRIRENPKVSTMGIATVERVAHTTVFRILWRQQLNPTVYRVYRRLNMLAMNREGYFVYFSILFTELLLKRTYLVSFMFTDEASFTRIELLMSIISTSVWVDQDDFWLLDWSSFFPKIYMTELSWIFSK